MTFKLYSLIFSHPWNSAWTLNISLSSPVSHALIPAAANLTDTLTNRLLIICLSLQFGVHNCKNVQKEEEIASPQFWHPSQCKCCFNRIVFELISNALSGEFQLVSVVLPYLPYARENFLKFLNIDWTMSRLRTLYLKYTLFVFYLFWYKCTFYHFYIHFYPHCF